MALKSWAAAQRHKGGVIKYLYDVVVGEETTDGTLSGKIETLETTVGGNDSGLVKDVADIKTAIGDEDTGASIIGRIKALEDKVNTE